MIPPKAKRVNGVNTRRKKKYPFIGIRPPKALEARIIAVSEKSKKSVSGLMVSMANKCLPAMERELGITN